MSGRMANMGISMISSVKLPKIYLCIQRYVYIIVSALGGERKELEKYVTLHLESSAFQKTS